MKRWLLVLLSLMLALAGALTVERSVPTALKLDFPLDTLNAPGCELPCWHGIRPGVTTYQQAANMMDADVGFGLATFTNRLDADQEVWRLLSAPTDDNSVTFSFDGQQRITAIRLYGRATPGQVLLLLGHPISATVTGCPGWITTLYYTHVTVELIHDSREDGLPKRFLPFQDDQITLTLAEPLNEEAAFGGDWLGFKTNYLHADGIGCD